MFERRGELFVPTELARGPWDPEACHGGPPAALLARAVERLEPRRSDLALARLTYEFLRPVPLAPLTVAARVLRPGRRVRWAEATLTSGGVEVTRLTALAVHRPADTIPAPDPLAPDPPERGRPVVFGLAPGPETSFAATAMEMRFLAGDIGPGPATVWMRLRHPLLSGEAPSGVQRAAATADFGNGVAHTLDFERYVFVNADLTVYLHREPEGEWVCLDARTVISPGAGALAESVLLDRRGGVGRAVQALLVAARP